MAHKKIAKAAIHPNVRPLGSSCRNVQTVLINPRKDPGRGLDMCTRAETEGHKVKLLGWLSGEPRVGPGKVRGD